MENIQFNNNNKESLLDQFTVVKNKLENIQQRYQRFINDKSNHENTELLNELTHKMPYLNNAFRIYENIHKRNLNDSKYDLTSEVNILDFFNALYDECDKLLSSCRGKTL